MKPRKINSKADRGQKTLRSTEKKKNFLCLSFLVYKIGLTLIGLLGGLTEKLHRVVRTAPGLLQTHLISNKAQDDNSRSSNRSNNSSE